MDINGEDIHVHLPPFKFSLKNRKFHDYSTTKIILEKKKRLNDTYLENGHAT
jgi:hypothetical protein